LSTPITGVPETSELAALEPIAKKVLGVSLSQIK
jgi:hypothetical protein